MIQQVIRKRRKARQAYTAISKFAGGDSSVEFGLPAGANLYVRSAEATDEVMEALQVGDRKIPCPALRAGQVHCVGFFPAGSKVSALGGLDLLADAGLGRYVKVGG